MQGVESPGVITTITGFDDLGIYAQSETTFCGGKCCFYCIFTPAAEKEAAAPAAETAFRSHRRPAPLPPSGASRES